MNRKLFATVLLVLWPIAISAQNLQQNIPIKNWPTALYWQPSIQEQQSSEFGSLDNEGNAVARADTLPTGSLVFVAMTPCRIADTRTGSGFSGAFGSPNLFAAMTRTFPIRSSPTCSVPSIAKAYSFNLTLVPSGFVDFITVWPTGQPRPNASTLNGYVNTVIANAAIVPAGTDGSVDVYASQNTNLIIDINGYYAPQSGLTLTQGTASAPPLSFSGDPGTGIFSSQPGTLDVAAGGTSALRVSSGETNINGNTIIGGTLTTNGSARIGIPGAIPPEAVRFAASGPVNVPYPLGGGVSGIGFDSFGVAGGSDKAMGVYAVSNGAGLNGPALRATNNNPSGIGIFSVNFSADANLVVSNGGSGPLIEGFCAGCGAASFLVQNNGATIVNSNAEGLNGTALRANNTNPLGIGIWSTTSSGDANLVLSNGGSGPLIRGFCAGCGNPAFEVQNNGTTITPVLQITGGSDLAEHFEVDEQIQPGMIVAINPKNPGKLEIARGAYNRRAAGVISGANNLRAGMLLPDLTGARKAVAVTLSGRVWVYCDATRDPIRPGDLLTTSHTPGHAMKVRDYGKAQGAIIGKAMTSLKSGRGLVLVLASLQ
jgi:hypothetical protein